AGVAPSLVIVGDPISEGRPDRGVLQGSTSFAGVSGFKYVNGKTMHPSGGQTSTEGHVNPFDQFDAPSAAYQRDATAPAKEQHT
ncbi:hypothetical protein WB403_49590, partial [Streptomyces brasiliscabiei]